MSEPTVDSAVSQPAPALRPYVRRYIGYSMEGFPPGIHRGLPSRHLTFILTLDGSVDLAADPDHPSVVESYAALVAGLHDGPVTIVHDGTQRGVQLEVTPLGARALFGMPAAELAAVTLPLDAVLGRSARELAERTRAAGGWAERFAAIDEVLARKLREPRPPAPEVNWAWERLVAAGGAVEIAALAREVGWSRRHLTERFAREVGLTPKATARVVRFERSRRLLASPRRPGLAHVAVACGYFDQAHMNRDWRQLAGCPPTVWMAEELPAIPDDDDTDLVEALAAAR